MGNHALIVYDNLPKRGEKMEIDKKLLFFDKILHFFLVDSKIVFIFVPKLIIV